MASWAEAQRGGGGLSSFFLLFCFCLYLFLLYIFHVLFSFIFVSKIVLQNIKLAPYLEWQNETRSQKVRYLNEIFCTSINLEGI